MDPTKRLRNYLTECAVALVRRDREFLIAQRSPDDSFGSFWEFPGGKREPGENLEQCLVREAREELGIGIEVQEKFMNVRTESAGRVLDLHFYLCRHVDGQPQPLESQRFQWVSVKDLKGFQFPPANQRVIERLVEIFS